MFPSVKVINLFSFSPSWTWYSLWYFDILDDPRNPCETSKWTALAATSSTLQDVPWESKSDQRYKDCDADIVIRAHINWDKLNACLRYMHRSNTIHSLANILELILPIWLEPQC
jgi:hypothetical protein